MIQLITTIANFLFTRNGGEVTIKNIILMTSNLFGVVLKKQSFYQDQNNAITLRVWECRHQPRCLMSQYVSD